MKLWLEERKIFSSSIKLGLGKLGRKDDTSLEELDLEI